MGWSEDHDKDDPMPNSMTEDSLESTPVFPSMLSNTPEPTDSCYRHMDPSKIADRIATPIQLLQHEVALRDYESWSAQEALYFAQSRN